MQNESSKPDQNIHYYIFMAKKSEKLMFWHPPLHGEKYEIAQGYT